MRVAPPNVLWIVTSQWRAQATGYAGDPNARTPHLDALATESVNYTQAVTPHPFGPFARAALMTGVPSPENGMRDYYDPLPPGARTIARELRERGYATGFFGKWHLAKRDRTAPLVGEIHARMIVPPEARGGFEFWEGFESGFMLNDPWLHGTRLEQPEKFQGYQSDVICDRASDWRVETEKQEAKSKNPRRWFCVVSLEPPHPPYDAPAAGVTPRNPSDMTLAANVPRGGEVEVRARRELAGYYAHLEATDRSIGRLVATLNARDTVVVFTSVHGDMHGAHGLFRKGWPHEESIRVPLLIRGAAAPRINPGAISLLDLSRMTINWAEGISPALDDRHRTISMPSAVAVPHQCDRQWRGVRTPQRKLVLNADGSPWLFFDLECDPLEMKNLVAATEHQPEIAALRALV